MDIKWINVIHDASTLGEKEGENGFKGTVSHEDEEAVFYATEESLMRQEKIKKARGQESRTSLQKE